MLVLHELGRDDLALALAETFDYPSWGYMVLIFTFIIIIVDLFFINRLFTQLSLLPPFGSFGTPLMAAHVSVSSSKYLIDH